jgi:hypothetical protein
MPTRETFIPIPKESLALALAGEGKLSAAETQRFEEVTRLISIILHHEHFDELERLRALYRPLDPNDVTDQAAEPQAFLAEFEAMLGKASFMELPIGVMGLSSSGMVQDLRLKLDESGVQRIRFFARGARAENITIKRWWGLYKKNVTADVLDDVIVVLECKSALAPSEVNFLTRHRRGVRPGAILLKHFGDVPQGDLLALHPGATPAMQRRDQLILGVPAIAGGIPLLTQMWSALTVLFAIAAAWFGMESAIDESQLKRALAAVSGFVALAAFMMRQRLKYNAQRLAYQKQLADTVYFHTIANNAGVLEGLVGSAEQQDAKEAILAYWALLAHGAMDKANLDKTCEAFLADRMGRACDFEIGDAMEKLERLRLVTREGALLRAVPAEEALVRLDEAWDGFFSYRRAGA